MSQMKWWGWGDEEVSFTHDDKPDAGAVRRARRSSIDLDGLAVASVDFDELDVAAPALAPDAARRARGGRRRGPRLGRRDGPRRPHLRQEPARPRARPPRRPRPAARRHRLPGHRGRGRRDHARRARRRRGRHPVRRRHQHLRQPRGTARTRPARWSPSTSAAWTACSRSTRRRGSPASRPARSARRSRSSSTRRGWTIGHFPDSFTYSTLGGWIATRSSGMQSDKYGDIADLTRAVRVVTPAGVLVTRPVPTTSTGPSVREMILGQRGPARHHHRGDRARAPRPGAAA